MERQRAWQLAAKSGADVDADAGANECADADGGEALAAKTGHSLWEVGCQLE